MAKLIIFVALLAVHYAYGVTENLRTSVNSGLYLNTATVEGELECQLETNTGDVYKFAPGDKIIPDATEMRIYSLDRSSCSVGVHPVQKTDAGVWKITVSGASAEEYTFNVYLNRNAGVIPSDSVYVKEGAFVHGMMAAPKSAFDNMKSCVITTPQKQSFDVHANPLDGVKPVGECGARIVGKLEFNGLWKFEITTSDFLVYSASMRVEVRPASKSADVAPPNPEILRHEFEMTLGLPGKIAAGPSAAKFCQLRNAEYTLLPPINGPCNYQIPVVTPRHQGFWFMYYALPGNLNLTVNHIKIVTREQRGIDSNVTHLTNGEIKISCSAHYAYTRSLSFCRFTKPNGDVLNAEPGITDKKYSTLEADETTNDRGKDIYCGLTIHEPENHDFGAWRCEVASKTSSKDVIGTIIRVQKNPSKAENFNSRIVQILPTEVIVKQGDRYSIKCKTDEVLDYCWFRSPNGTSYSISTSKSEQLPPNILPYKGAGLSMGECAAEIESAEFSDDGEWSCHLGIANGKEESQKFPVKVTENYLIARREKMTPFDGISLSCRILPREQDRTVHYCRWIRPDGYGIYNGAGDRYRTSTSKTECELVIEVLKKEDEGNWTCVAGVKGAQIEEMQASMVLESRRFYLSGLVLGFSIAGCVMLTMTIVTMIIVKVYRRRQQLMPRQPPAYEADPNPSPKSLNPSFATKEFQY